MQSRPIGQPSGEKQRINAIRNIGHVGRGVGDAVAIDTTRPDGVNVVKRETDRCETIVVDESVALVAALCYEYMPRVHSVRLIGSRFGG